MRRAYHMNRDMKYNRSNRYGPRSSKMAPRYLLKKITDVYYATLWMPRVSHLLSNKGRGQRERVRTQRDGSILLPLSASGGHPLALDMPQGKEVFFEYRSAVSGSVRWY